MRVRTHSAHSTTLTPPQLKDGMTVWRFFFSFAIFIVVFSSACFSSRLIASTKPSPFLRKS